MRMVPIVSVCPDILVPTARTHRVSATPALTGVFVSRTSLQWMELLASVQITSWVGVFIVCYSTFTNFCQSYHALVQVTERNRQYDLGREKHSQA